MVAVVSYRRMVLALTRRMLLRLCAIGLMRLALPAEEAKLDAETLVVEEVRSRLTSCRGMRCCTGKRCRAC